MYQNIAPIDRLPEHVLSEILTHAYEGSRYPKDSNGLDNALAVSRHWRRTALLTHALWRTLDLREESFTSGDDIWLYTLSQITQSRLKRYLAHSGVRCNLTVSLDSDFWSKNRSTYKFLMSITARCRVLAFDVFGNGNIMWQFIRKASQLVELKISAMDDPFLPSDDPIVLERLKKLTIWDFPYDICPLDALICPQLEELRLEYGAVTCSSWNNFMTLSTPSKVKLHGIDWSLDDPPNPDEHLDTWIGIQTPLSVLKVSSDNGELPSSIEKEIIRGCAHLTRLSVLISEQSLPPIVQPYSLLTQLKLYYMEQSSHLVVMEIKDWQRVFQYLPALNRMGFKRHGHIRYSQRSLGRHAINPILLSLTLPPETPICPLLRNLDYDVDLKCDWSILLAFSRSRSHISRGGTVQSFTGSLCRITLGNYEEWVCEDVFYEELKDYEELLHREYWQKWQEASISHEIWVA